MADKKFKVSEVNGEIREQVFSILESSLKESGAEQYNTGTYGISVKDLTGAERIVEVKITAKKADFDIGEALEDYQNKLTAKEEREIKAKAKAVKVTKIAKKD